MKKIISKTMFLIMAFGILCTTAFAKQTTGEEMNRTNRLLAYANMSIEEASPELQEQILAARNEIIFNTSWSADDIEIVIEHTDGTTETVPKFSELFHDWDMPTAKNNEQNINHTIDPLSVSTMAYHYYLRNPGNTITDPFTAFYHDGSYVRTTATTLYASEHCNIGYTDYTTGESLGWVSYLYPGDSATLYTLGTEGFYCAVRASTYSSPGYSILTVTHDESVSIR